MIKQLIALKNDDYQNRQGNAPVANKIDSINVYQNQDGTVQVNYSFHWTSHEIAISIAEAQLSEYVPSAMKNIQKITVSDINGDYAEDWTEVAMTINPSQVQNTAVEYRYWADENDNGWSDNEYDETTEW